MPRPVTACTSPWAGGRRDVKFALSATICDNYAVRSTRHVAIGRNQDELGRYSDPPLLVLASLASGPKHGHAMIEDIVALSGTRLGPGTLYGAISRLELAGLIAPLSSSDRRQPYRITAQGAKRLRAQLSTLQQFARAGAQRLKFL
jgi:DNA-binding PadR family transcriptional regulator